MTGPDTGDDPRSHLVAARDVDMLLATQGIRAILRLMGVDPDRPDLRETPTRVVDAATEFAGLVRGGPMTTDDDFTAGFYDDIPERDYHLGEFGPKGGSLSVSGAKTIHQFQSPAKFRWEQNHPVFKDSFDEGSAAHALVLGRGMESIYVAPYDNWNTKQAQLEKKLAHADGMSAILPRQWDTVCDMADALSGHTLAMELLPEGRPEVSGYAEDHTGVWRRCRFDWLRTDLGVDYKTTRSANPRLFKKDAASYGYHMQHAWYLDVAFMLGVELRGFVFIVQEKEPPFFVEVVELDVDAVNRGRDLNERAVDKFRHGLETGMWPSYTPGNTITSVGLPPWAFYDD